MSTVNAERIPTYRFHFPLNEAEIGDTVTVHVASVYSESRKANKRALRKYLSEYHGIPDKQHKTILKAMGFWGTKLGTIS